MRLNESSIERLPEMDMFRDNGCSSHPSCLTCPLPRCRYDDPGWLQREERENRDAEVLRLKVRHQLSVDQLANKFGVSTRTVHRILRRGGPEHLVA